MLPDYDAEAIAEVLGIAFRRDPDRHAVLAAQHPGPESKRFRLRSQSLRGDITGLLDESPIDVVDADAREPDRERDPHASSVLIERAVESGLPRFALRRVAERLSGGDATKISALEWGVVPKTTLERRSTRLSASESERTERIARLFVHARRALGTVAEARAFMTTAHPELDGRSPIEAALTDLGSRRTEQLLTALEFGLAL